MNIEDREMGFAGISTFCKFCHTRNLEGVDGAIIGVPLDTGVTNRSGTSFGPRAIRSASQLYGVTFEPGNGIYDVDLEKFILEGKKIIDYGDISVGPVSPEKNFDMITGKISEILKQGVFPVTIGGDHSITFPLIRAFSDKSIDIIHFDTHLDFMDDVEGFGCMSHANPMKRSSELDHVNKITQIGIRGLLNPLMIFKEAKDYGSKIITANKVIGNGIDWTLEQIPDGKDIYVTIDIDVLDPSVAPGTGTPEPGGLSYLQLKEILTGLPKKGNIVGFDIVEVNPLFDHGEITAQVAARLIIDFLGAIMDK